MLCGLVAGRDARVVGGRLLVDAAGQLRSVVLFDGCKFAIAAKATGQAMQRWSCVGHVKIRMPKWGTK